MAALRIGAKNFKRVIIFIKFIPILSNGHVVKWLRTLNQNLKQFHLTRLERGKIRAFDLW